MCPHLPLLHGRGPAKVLVGELPKPAGLLDKVSRSPIVCGPALPLLGLIFPPVRVAEQVIDVRLDRHSLPHIRLGFAVFGIEGLFPVRQLPAFLFSTSIFGSFAPSSRSLMAAFAAR